MHEIDCAGTVRLLEGLMHDIAVPLIDTNAVLLQSETVDASTAWGALVIVAALAAGTAILRWRLWSIPSKPLGRLPVEVPLWMLGALVSYAAGAFGAAVSLTDDMAYARLASNVLGNGAQVVAAAIFLTRFTRPSGLPASPPFHAALAGVVAFMLITPIVASLSIALNALLVSLGQPRTPDAAHQTLAILAERRDPMLTALTLAHVALLVPIAEEFIWRGMVQPGIRSALGAWPGIAITTVLFTLIHWGALAPEGRVVGLSMLVALALGLGILRERTGSVLAPIVVHALFNALNVALTLLKSPAP